MCQVLENLLDNALSFSPAGVEIELQREGGEVCLLVRDRGPGLHQEHAARIFDRFFSYSPPERAKRAPGGSAALHSGLGLSIVKAIVDGYGGSVKARGNGVEAGACFEVRLPLV